MRILIAGACGFVGSALSEAIAAAGVDWQVVGFDNLGRPGSELNRQRLAQFGVKLQHGDLRRQGDVDALPAVDWIVVCAANASVLAGADGQTSSRQLMEYNLFGTVHILEKCKRDRAGFVLLSTSRVYAIEPLAKLPVEARGGAYQLSADDSLPPGVSGQGVDETFSTAAPVSLYGASKLASEALALEYCATFGFPCGSTAAG